LSVAAGNDIPDVHCPHTGYTGGGQCGSWCTNYCDRALSLCSSPTISPSIYPDMPTCMRACAAMNTGNQTDQSGASVTCRTYHAVASLVYNDNVHCTHASQPSASGVCGTSIQNLCQFHINACTGSLQSFNSEAQCNNIFATFPIGFPNATGGNSVDCRLYHVGYGITQNLTSVHCPHADVTGGNGVCGTICDGFCQLMNATCPSNYGSNAACATACAAFPSNGIDGAVSGNTAQCRVYHAGVASTPGGSPLYSVTHCPHTTISGGGVCSSSSTDTSASGTASGTGTGTSSGTGTATATGTTSSASVIVAGVFALSTLLI